MLDSYADQGRTLLGLAEERKLLFGTTPRSRCRTAPTPSVALPGRSTAASAPRGGSGPWRPTRPTSRCRRSPIMSSRCSSWTRF